jgi:molybdate transport system substrate-binding protein
VSIAIELRSILRVAAAIAVALCVSRGVPIAHAQTVTVFAAASLKDALDEIEALRNKRGGTKTVIAYAASSALARQVESGAPADVFVSADLDWMDYLEKRKLVRSSTRTNLLRNELVLVAPAASRVSLAVQPNFPLAAQLGDGRLAMGDPDHVPAGKYAKAALQTLGVWTSVADRIARAENVRAALVFVARGEAPLGIVYRTDAAADTRVRIVSTLPASSHPPIVYPAAALNTSRNAGAAERYLAVLKSRDALAVFRKHGFTPFDAP